MQSNKLSTPCGKVFVDFHHSSLLRSLVMLFEGRLGYEVYRPIGMEWFTEGFWKINDQLDTAYQFLSLDQAYKPSDGTPKLNETLHCLDEGVFWCADPGGKTHHKACTLDFFKNNQFDYVIASIPAHVPVFEELIRRYQKHAKLIIQMGNNWNLSNYAGHNILASLEPQICPGVNAMFYHQEFDNRSIFYHTKATPTKKIYSFVNIIQNTGQGWEDWNALKKLLEPEGFEFKAFGGQCPDGNMNGPEELADAMRECQFVFHVKPGGDGFGHIIHNAYAVGRPVITRRSYYAGQLADHLFSIGTYIDLDMYEYKDVRGIIKRITKDTNELETMGEYAYSSFQRTVDYLEEAKQIKSWIEKL